MSRWTVLAVVLALQACGKEPPAPPAASPQSPPQAVEPPSAPTAPTRPKPGPEQALAVAPLAPRAAPPADAAPAAPILVLSLNGQAYEPQVAAGWPLVVVLEMRSPDGKPWRVSDAAGSWASLDRLDPAWPLVPAGSPPKEAVADASTSPRLVWTLGPEGTSKLPVGTHEVRAILDSTGVKAASRPLRVRVLAPPADPRPGRGGAECRDRGPLRVLGGRAREGPGRASGPRALDVASVVARGGAPREGGPRVRRDRGGRPRDRSLSRAGSRAPPCADAPALAA